MIRLTPIWGDPLDPGKLRSVNDLVQARIDGRISRRSLIKRASTLGISGAIAGVMLHATSDLAFGAPSGGRQRALSRFQSTDTMPVTGPTQPEGTAIDGGVVVVGGTHEPETLHPMLTQLLVGFDMFSAFGEGLLAYDPNVELQPALATAFSISDDGLSYTFALRPNVRYHNGDTFTAEDVVNTWKVVNDPEFGTYNVFSWDKVTDVVPSGDGSQVTISTGEPYAPLLSTLSVGPICPTSEIAKGPKVFAQDFGRNPVGTGAFKFAEWKPQQQITFDRFDDYWAGKPKLDQLFYRIVPDDNTQLVQLRTGEVHLCSSAGGISAIRVKEALEIEGVQILETPSTGWKHFDLKHVDHLRVTKVRQALDFATPKKQIIENLLENRVLPGAADQTPGTWAFNPNVQPRPYDPEKAKQLLEEAGLTLHDGVWTGPTPPPQKDIDPNTDRSGPVKPLEIELWAQLGETQDELIQQVVAQAWNEIGIKAEPKYEDQSTIFGPEGFQFTDKMTAGLSFWYNTTDPDSTWFWSSSYIPADPTAAGGNMPAYFFPFNFQAEIDALVDPAVIEFDQEKRKDLYWKSQVLLQQEAPVIFLYWEKAFSAVAHNISGFWPTTFNSLFWNAKDWYLTE